LSQPGPIDVLEAAYEVGRPRDPWLRGVLEATAPLMEPCIGCVAYFVDPSGPVTEGLATAGTPWFRSEDVAQILQRAPRDGMRRALLDAASMATALSESVARGEMTRNYFDDLVRRFAGMKPRAGHAGDATPIRDFLGVLAIDSERRGVVVSSAYDRVFTLDRAARRRWSLVAVHIATAARLRRALEASALRADAVLTPAGKVVHAEGDATSRSARETLRERVVAVDRARGRMRRSDPDAALETWRGLVSGRWSLVDRFESDGRRYVVAHRNEPVPAQILSLTLRERQAIGHVLAGHPAKVVAYALGVSPAAISAALRSAMGKLGAGTLAQLVQRLDEALIASAATDGTTRE
jgi:DNA-binding CsgD family transcriptional regulator